MNLEALAQQRKSLAFALKGLEPGTPEYKDNVSKQEALLKEMATLARLEDPATAYGLAYGTGDNG